MQFLMGQRMNQLNSGLDAVLSRFDYDIQGIRIKQATKTPFKVSGKGSSLLAKSPISSGALSN